MSEKPAGFYKHILVVDCETSGLCNIGDDPSYDPSNDTTYQMVSIGLIVADSETLKPVDKLYLEIQFDENENTWLSGAESVHGLSRQYLKDNGVTEEDAVVQIANLILNYWGTTPVHCAGHNFVSFDLHFLKRLLRKFNLEINFAARHIDTNSIGFATLGTYNSSDLFEIFGFKRESHNAMEDAEYALKTIYNIRTIFDSFL